jgi:hypothetical protein
MIKVSPALQTVLQRDVKEFCHVIKIFNYYGVGLHKFITDNPFDVELSDGDVYPADGRLMEVVPLKISTNVDRDEFSFTISDSSFAEASYLESGIVNKKVTIRAVFYDYDTLLTNLSDTLFMYSGYGNGATYVIKTGESGEAYIKITCTNPMSDLDYKKGIFLNKEFMRNQNPKDTSCDSVYTGSGVMQLKWGKR